MGTWFSLFNNWETFIGQLIALALVIGSYVAASTCVYGRPRRRGEEAARRADAIPESAAPVRASDPAAAAPNVPATA